MEGITYSLPFLNRLIEDYGTHTRIWTTKGGKFHFKEGVSAKRYLDFKDIKPDR